MNFRVYPDTFRGGVIACVRTLAGIVARVEALPMDEAQRLLGARARRAVIVDLLTLIGEELSGLVTGGANGTVFGGDGSAYAARGASDDASARG